MAKYEVVAETLGANPTYRAGDIIEDSGELRPPYDFGWLVRSGAIKELDAAEPDRAMDPHRPSDVQPGIVDDPEVARLATRRGETVPLTDGLPPMTGHSQGVPPTDLLLVDLDDDQRAALADAGIRTPDDVRGASDERLRAVKGIGPATLAKLREATRE